jgi:DNA-directed RNA polymerase subunit RPC12/RpoP
MPELAICLGCGKNVDPAVAYVREDGLRCPECNVRMEMREDQDRLQGRELVDLQASLSRRARRLARVHAIMWMAVVILLAAGKDGWYTPLLAPPLVLAFGLSLRKRWAFYGAALLDGAAIVTVAVLAVLNVMPALGAGVAAFFALFLLVLVLVLREAFVPPSA